MLPIHPENLVQFSLKNICLFLGFPRILSDVCVEIVFFLGFLVSNSVELLVIDVTWLNRQTQNLSRIFLTVYNVAKNVSLICFYRHCRVYDEFHDTRQNFLIIQVKCNSKGTLTISFLFLFY